MPTDLFSTGPSSNAKNIIGAVASGTFVLGGIALSAVNPVLGATMLYKGLCIGGGITASTVGTGGLIYFGKKISGVLEHQKFLNWIDEMSKTMRNIHEEAERSVENSHAQIHRLGIEIAPTTTITPQNQSAGAPDLNAPGQASTRLFDNRIQNSSAEEIIVSEQASTHRPQAAC